jgi:hypothetical protein
MLKVLLNGNTSAVYHDRKSELFNFSGHSITNCKRRNIFLEIWSVSQTRWFGSSVVKEGHDL